MTDEKQSSTGKDKVVKGNEYGQIKIADDAIATIVSMATLEVEGVAGMNGGVTSNLTEILGKKNMTKGVKLDINNNKISVEIYLIAYYGVILPALANDVQIRVKNALESMADLEVTGVNIHVQGLIFRENTPTKEENTTVEE